MSPLPPPCRTAFQSTPPLPRTHSHTHADGRNKNGRSLRREHVCRDCKGGRGACGAVYGSMGRAGAREHQGGGWEVF